MTQVPRIWHRFHPSMLTDRCRRASASSHESARASERLINKFKDKLPTFGDYTTDNIEFLPSMDMRKVNPSAKLIYTLPQHWYVLKAKAFRGNEVQMVSLCSNVIRLSGYKGIPFSDGDKRIHDTAHGKANFGNLGTWKQVAINHHMTKVVHQLSSYHASII